MIHDVVIYYQTSTPSPTSGGSMLPLTAKMLCETSTSMISILDEVMYSSLVSPVS
ncbi:MAG: hypothetical protein ACOYEG_10165 [Petrimonas sp.]